MEYAEIIQMMTPIAGAVLDVVFNWGNMTLPVVPRMCLPT